MFVCPIPGADQGTILWHALLHYGLAAIVVTIGAVFLGLAVIAYRADAPARRQVATAPMDPRTSTATSKP
jgi:hypothetical protein